MAGEEQRVEARVRSRGQFALFVDGAPPIPATVFDVSPNGIGLETDTLIRHGTAVRLDCLGIAADGVVRYCRAHGARYRIGVSLSAPSIT